MHIYVLKILKMPKDVKQVKGYKIFGPNYTYSGHEYSLTEPNVYQGNLEMYKSEIHFYQRAVDCLIYYELNKKIRMLK